METHVDELHKNFAECILDNYSAALLMANLPVKLHLLLVPRGKGDSNEWCGGSCQEIEHHKAEGE